MTTTPRPENSDDFFKHFLPPTQVKGLANVVSLAITRNQNCALLQDSSSRCWGGRTFLSRSNFLGFDTDPKRYETEEFRNKFNVDTEGNFSTPFIHERFPKDITKLTANSGKFHFWINGKYLNQAMFHPFWIRGLYDYPGNEEDSLKTDGPSPTEVIGTGSSSCIIQNDSFRCGGTRMNLKFIIYPTELCNPPRYGEEEETYCRWPRNNWYTFPDSLFQKESLQSQLNNRP